MALRVWLWLLSLTVLWGGSFFFAKVALAELGPFTVAFARVSLAALALALFVPLRRDAPWSTYFAMGFLNNALPFSLIFWGQTEIGSGLASILNATTPLFTLVVAHILTADEKMDRTKVAALLIGLLGVVVRSIFSSGVRKWATTSVKSGVVALMIEASPTAISVWPQKIRLKGRALFRNPMAK